MNTTRLLQPRYRDLLRRGTGFFFACFLALQAGTTAAEAGIVTREIAGAEFEDVAFALVDAIAAEGITPPTVSHFGDMLRRTAPDLGHSPALFDQARIYTFCSASAAARLSAESPHHIALCPLSIAVYRIAADSPVVHLGYRRSASTAGGVAVDALLGRIVDRTAEFLK
ncbi:DUF302 domain-containing protein [Thauera sp. Sel9]|uniref:DUF302 domain-containing protein n=1 Tax=Thauera sp. Sel9 TaxID=2974299 RepID=UPI0021E18E9D|nr:DUF302 domain-containing protein [Thauera sp. Sel9]MCV2219420.1 DUF302 domain-containing protein [Thauera sp. Sel9]